MTEKYNRWLPFTNEEIETLFSGLGWIISETEPRYREDYNLLNEELDAELKRRKICR